MARYNRRARRRNFRRRPTRRMYRTGKRVSRPIGSGETGRRFFLLKRIVNIMSDSGGEFAGFYSDDPTGYSDFSNIASLFDYYRVCAMKIKYIPSVMDNSSTSTVYSPGYVVHDLSDVLTGLTVTDAIQYEDMKVVNLLRPFTYYKKMQRNINVTINANVSRNAYLPTSTPAGTQSFAFISSSGLAASQTYGTVIQYLYLVAKARS